jgi:hypothetical protein
MLPEISREGALAGRAFSLTLLASAIGLIALSWDDIWRVAVRSTATAWSDRRAR